MELYDIVNSISAIEQVNLVLHRSMQVQKVKVYKKFVYNLYSIDGEFKNLIFSKEYILKVPNADIEQKWDESDKKYLDELLKWFKYGNEQVSDTNN